MDMLDFSEEEIQEQLELLGYTNIPKHRLREFKQDLDELIQRGEWKSLTSPTQMNSTKSQKPSAQPSPPAYTKEKVSQCYFEDSGEGFFLHAGQADHNRQVLTTCYNRDCGQQQRRCDSYAQHSVALKTQLPPGAPNRLQVEPDPDDTLHPPPTDSYTSSPDTQGRRFIKRKVLRKHQGKSLVCDESIYSEDSDHSPQQEKQVATMYKMYNNQFDSDDDENSLNSSFWSDGEHNDTKEEEEEKKVEMERVISGEDSKPAGAAEDSVKEASEEGKAELNNGNMREESSEGGSDDDDGGEDEDDYDEEDEDEEDEENTVGETEEGEEDEEEEAGETEEGEEEEDGEGEVGETEEGEEEEDGEGEVGETEEGEEEEGGEEEVEETEEAGEDEEEAGEKVAETEGEAGETADEEDEEGEVEETEGGEADEDEDGGEEEEEAEEDEDESCSSSCESPAPSLMTSGYGTYRPEEQDGGDYRDNHTITEFDQDSRGDLSETRDDEDDDRSLCSFGGFDIEPAEPDCSESRPLSVLPDDKPEAMMTCCGDDGLLEEVNTTDMNPGEDPEQRCEEMCDDTNAENKVRNATSADPQQVAGGENTLVFDEKRSEGGSHDDEREEEMQHLGEENAVEKEDKVDSDPDEESSNKDIKFIDSRVDFSQMTYDKMCEEWEGNLRHKRDAASCLEEGLAELHLSTAARRDFETENEDVTSQSDTRSSETDGASMTAFESYIRGMAGAQSDGDLKPKPKSFIRPVMSQQTKKKTDPVAKYFQYKQLWEMFKLPGETDRRALRLEIKERLAYQPPPPKPRRVYVPNTYIVPTEKKRSALRWEIRNDLANGLIPYKFSYRF